MDNFLDYRGLQLYHKKQKIETVHGLEFSVTLNHDQWQDKTCTVQNNNFLSDYFYKYLVSFSNESKDTYLTNAVFMNDVTKDGEASFVCRTEPQEDIIINILRLEVYPNG